MSSEADSFPKYQELLQQHSFPLSDDTFSNFDSHLGDAQVGGGDETITLSRPRAEIQDIQQIATLLAKHRGVDPMSLFEEVTELCRGRLNTLPILESLSSSAVGLANIEGQIDIEWQPPARRARSATILDERRRFPFDPGDDSGFGSFQSMPDKPATRGHSPLRRSQTISYLNSGSHTPDRTSSRPLLRVLPITPVMSDCVVPSSRIPSPNVTSGFLAQPRRGDSTSSVVTAVQHGQRSNPSSSSTSRSGSYSSNVNQPAMTQPTGSPEGMSQRSTSSSSVLTGSAGSAGSRLVDEKRSLRTNLALAAARAAGNRYSGGHNGVPSPRQRVSQSCSGRSSISSRSKHSKVGSPDHSVKENVVDESGVIVE